MVEPEWICWDESKRNLWVRDLPQDATMTADNAPLWYNAAMTFEDFVPQWQFAFSQEQLTACFIGIRTAESLNRWRAICGNKSSFDGLLYTTYKSRACYNVYPIYDWKTEDVWRYLGKFGKSYCKLYDRMHQAGLTPHQMRICEPYGDEQRKGLWLYHLVEPETWARVAARVAGANSASLYAEESGNVLGNRSVSLPAGHTWKSFCEFLLDTLPPKTAEHYRNKFAVYLHYCAAKLGLFDIPDKVEGDCSSADIPSWRRLCRCILRNDYWCKSLSFSPTKGEAYERYSKLMKRRRDKWNLI